MGKRIYVFRRIIKVGVVAVVCLIAFVFAGCSSRSFQGFDETEFENPATSFESDLDGDDIVEYGKIVFDEGFGKAEILKNGEVIFESPPELNVQEILAGDFDNDGMMEFGLSLWKTGNYGTAMPFWIKENDNSYKMHLFLYRLENGVIKPVWHSSNLPKENLRVRLIDFDEDGENELVVKERNYGEGGKGEFAVWKWDEWGFTKLDFFVPFP